MMLCLTLQGPDLLCVSCVTVHAMATARRTSARTAQGWTLLSKARILGSMNVVSDHQAICIFSSEETTAIELVILLHLYD